MFAYEAYWRGLLLQAFVEVSDYFDAVYAFQASEFAQHAVKCYFCGPEFVLL